jgi:dipeptidyl aminopeptidase/acylaminoacyl peptidase
MKNQRDLCTLFSSPGREVAALFLALLALLLLGCGGPEPTPQILVITATFTPQSQVQVVTATYTPQTRVQVVTATFTPAPEGGDVLLPSPTTGAAVQPVQPAATDVLVLPTAPPTEPPTVAPTAPPTAPPTVAPTAAPTAKPTAKPQASVRAYGVIYSNFDGGSESDEFKYSMWVMRGDGSEATEVFRPAIEPAYSPNGKKVAFYRPFNGIWVYDLDKKSANHVVVSDYAEFASFSPDGKELVFHEWVGNWWSANVNLYIVNADGSNRRQLPQGIRPAWSPKGGLIAFDSCRDTRCGIFVVQPNGQGFRQVTSDGGGKVSWSPDGKRLIYSAEVGGNPEIFVVNLDGSGRKQLTQNTGNDTLPVYSPDGLKIFFLSDQNGKAWAIRSMNPDGSDVQTVRKVGVPPRWQFSRLWVGWW